MVEDQNSSVSDPAAAGRKKILVIVGIVILVGVALIGGGAYLVLHQGKRVAAAPPPESVAELVSTSGMILVRNPGNPEWREVKKGARFTEGDLVRTDSSGEAGIRYKSGRIVSIPGNMVMRVRKLADNEMEITPSPDATMPPLRLLDENGNPAKGVGNGPFIELQQIIPFGKCLELIGRVETGSSLLVNDEIVEVSGEGKFKHFTRPFPASAEVVRLILKVSDLAGRSRTYTATHDFRTYGGVN